MTKEEAGNIISGYEVYGCGYCLQGGDEVEEALRLAVDALRQETVIRCKDCLKANLCIVYRDSKDPYGFCKWAVRREK